MMVSYKHHFTGKQSNPVDIKDYVSALLAGDDDPYCCGGQLEKTQREVERLCEGIGRLLDVLAESRAINAEQLSYVIHGRGYKYNELKLVPNEE